MLPRTENPTVVGAGSLTGTVLADRYELRGFLGRGGMGEVYEAVDRRLDRTVAVKVLRPEIGADRRFVARFHREARTAARLAHPGIVAVHDYGQDGERVFLVLEHVPGRTLTEMVRRDGPPAPGRVAEIGAEVAEALAHAHARGVVHRDIAPSNVMVRDDGTTKVLDFGIAAAAISSGHGGSVTAHGTLAYAAPEVLAGLPSDQRVDVYGLGAVLYELLAGDPPFRGADVAARLQVATPPSLHQRDPSVPAGLDETVLRCLSRSPDARDTDAGTLAAELRRLAVYLPRVAPPVRTAPEPLRTTPVAVNPATARLPSPDDPAMPSTHVLPGTRRSRRRRRTSRVISFLVAFVVLGAAAMVSVPALFALDDPIRPRTTPPDALPAPRGVTAVASCDGFLATGVDLSWSRVGAATGYEVQRKSGTAATWDTVVVTGSATRAIRDGDLGVDALYAYRVRAMNGPLPGGWSTRARASTPLLCLT
ncbi:MAG: protein kinase domain-containing protein [Actinomycetota bacterium]